MEQKEKIHLWASRAVCVAFFLALLYWFGKYGISIAMPFLLGGAVAMAVHPLGRRLSALTGIGQRVCNVAVLVALICLLGGAGYLAGHALWRQAVEFYVWLQGNADSVISALAGLFSVGEGGASLPIFIEKVIKLPLIADLLGGLDSLVMTLTEQLLTRLGQALTSAAMGAAAAVPRAVLSVLVFFLTCFYLSLDGARLFSSLLDCLPVGSREGVRQKCAAMADALRAYLRAYVLIFLLTLAELTVGFCIVGVRYAFLIAVLVALLDLLPVLGSGAVLLPWSAVAFLSRDVRTGVGMLVLWGVITLVRQIAEPRIVGGSLGLHPLLALAGMYVGFRLFGAIGLVLGPCAIVICKVLLQNTATENK